MYSRETDRLMNSNSETRFWVGVCQAPLWFDLIRMLSSWNAIVSSFEAKKNWEMDGWKGGMDGWENVTTSEALSTATLNRQRACLEPRLYLWSSKEGWHTHAHAHPQIIDSYRKTHACASVAHANLHIDFFSHIINKEKQFLHTWRQHKYHRW